MNTQKVVTKKTNTGNRFVITFLHDCYTLHLQYISQMRCILRNKKNTVIILCGSDSKFGN